jgi:CheY-like chemotaxis protein
VSGPGRRILLVDDNQELAELLQLALETEGHEVAVASNGRQALELQRRFAAAVLVTDLVMPERDGFETIDAFQREFPGVKIVVMSGQGRLNAQRYLTAAKLMGVDAVLQKPFRVEDLLEIVASL